MCSGKFNKAQSAPEEKCSSRYAPAEQLEEIVWKDLCEVLTHPESITDALRRAHGGKWLPQELKARQENLRQGRAALARQLERLTEAYLGEVIPLAEYQRRRQDLERREEALASREKQLQAQSRQRMELAGVAASIEDFCKRVRSGLADATFEQRRKLVELLIDRVIVLKEEVEIRYVIPTDPSSEQVRFCHLRTDYRADDRLDRAEQEDEQRLREVMCERRSVRICCHESPHGEAARPCLRPFHTVSNPSSGKFTYMEGLQAPSTSTGSGCLKAQAPARDTSLRLWSGQILAGLLLSLLLIMRLVFVHLFLLGFLLGT